MDLANDESKETEALIRSRLDHFIPMILGFAKEAGIVTGRPVSLGYETPFWKEVRIGFKKKKLQGRPDYALWYGHQGDLETNLVIVEAKTRDGLGKGQTQALAYMGKSGASH